MGGAITVLVVDDQERARDLLGAELREAGFEVALAADGEEAWRTFCARGAEVVVTDLAMPRCDGIELLRRIRQRSDVPVIVFSGHGSIETAVAAPCRMRFGISCRVHYSPALISIGSSAARA
jgi:DNA-binding NtrC family response regulator